MPLLVADQRSPEWFDARRGKITASLAAACLGMDPNKGELAAFNEIMGLSKQKDNRHMAWGRKFEPQARAAYEAHTGNLAFETGLWVHPRYPWLAASPDGLIDDDGVLEVKVPGTLPAKAPAKHLIQVRVQIACTERKWGDYWAWVHPEFSDAEPLTFLKRVEADEWGDPELIRNLELWFEAHVKTNTPPRKRKVKP